MTDAHERSGLGRPAVIAIGFAVVALLTSVIAVIVVVRRSGDAPIAAAKSAAVIERTIDAGEVMKLKRDVVEKVTDDKGAVLGVKLKDEALRAALGLEPGDVITVIGGRAIKRELDVYDAVVGMSLMDASVIYIDILRAKRPALVRWKLDGDLRSAKRAPIRRPPTAGGLAANPFTAAPDPLVDTITKIDALHYEVPRSTTDRLLANPDAYALQARIVPSVRNGQPQGFKLYAITAGSLWAAIGLQNGDTLIAINGRELSTPDQALELYTKLKDAAQLQILVGRRGGPDETIVISIK